MTFIQSTLKLRVLSLELDTTWSLALIQPFKPHYQHLYSPYCFQYIPFGTSWENLLQNQDMARMIDEVVILLGDACHYWGLKG